MRVDINCDMGESFGAYRLGFDHEMMQHITSANIACGFHAGDPAVMERTVDLAVANGVRIGAHPGYPDLLGFGRRTMALSSEEVELYVLYQLGALYAFTRAHGVEMQHVAPHGALANVAAVDLATAQAIANAVAKFSKSLILAAVAASHLVTAGKQVGLRVAELVAIDRAYNDDGTVVPRNKPGSVLHESAQVAERAVRLVRDGTMVSYAGKPFSFRADTITLHGDNPTAVQNATMVATALREAGVELKPMSEIV
jgi:UPF0271 protein